MSGSRVVMRLAGITAVLMVAGCSSQTVQPAPVQIVSPSPPSPYFNGFRPNGAYPQQYFGGPQQQFNGVLPPQFIGGPNVAQRFYNNGQNPAYNGQFVPILQQSFDISPEGSYTFGYQSADGTQRQEAGGLRYPAVQGYPPVMAVQGSYSAITPEGIPIEVSYVADENGYQPTGPGVHPAIQRAVAQQVAQAKLEPPQFNK
ncbi:endocuticle structural glycoprotein SgAbd-9-like [Metopolophium dirhodum]|uniref:endocuticle structural glycoprotein SgAbd-9-like n=1 Tax=Metopolophium dirhodum TaxID=44670 RepID=UPI00298FFFF1|nr:endocuticle structural glycoprotein SgAbd-9-like [Metopolophium dirhodum]